MDINKQIKSIVNEGFIAGVKHVVRHPGDSAKDVVDFAKGGIANSSKILGRRLKNAASDTISDNPKTAAAVAGASGILGAGLMAKKYLARKLKK